MTINYTTGYAGTGKSTKLIQLVPTLNPKTTVIVCPTHKAIARLANSIPSNYELKTIHSLLGWIPTINEEAEHIGHIDSTAKLGKDISVYDTIVIDEAGMMSEDMLMEITSRFEDIHNYETDHISLHLFLDPYQLLPVKGRQIQTDPLTTTNLTVQYRSESPDIVTLYTKFVDYLRGTNTEDLTTPYSENILPLDITKFKVGDRLLGFTNEAVGDWNQKIALQLGINSYIGQEVQLGSRLDLFTCDEIVDDLDILDLMGAYTADTLLLQNNRISRQYIESSLRQLLSNRSIQFIRSGELLIPVIIGIGNANKVLIEAKQKAIKNRPAFADVYTLGRAFTMDYSFASTVHKAQGSEFDTVFIDKEDIKKSIFGGSYINYSRLMYVGISRSKRTLFI